ncbi:hypothetical protein IAI19_11740, partial [Streptococcus pseudopneumoniae]|uniref:hypothetical protein n=1 Tax=Streptococcus pseudopneumoniae TaxID=257758 RepID=UPI0018B05699
YGYDTTDSLIDGKFTLHKTYEDATVSFDLVVRGDSAASFRTSCADVEANFRTPRQLVKVEFVDPVSGSNVHETWDPASNT